MPDPADLNEAISSCRLCASRFAQTATAHVPRPVFWMRPEARVVIAGQAPGMRVHQSGRPFSDPSGDRLRDWMGIGTDQFYNKDKIAILPMAFCFPGYDAQGRDLPPPPICAKTWRDPVVASFEKLELTLLVGGYAQRWHLGVKTNMSQTVAAWRSYAPDVFPLPHPSWRNTAWLKKNPWFADELLPVLRARLEEVLA